MELKIKTFPLIANENCGLKCLKVIFSYHKVNPDNFYELLSKSQRLSSHVWITDWENRSLLWFQSINF